MLTLRNLLWTVALVSAAQPAAAAENTDDPPPSGRRSEISLPSRLDATAAWKPLGDPGYGLGVWLSFPIDRNGLNDWFNLELGVVADHKRRTFSRSCAFDVDRIAGLAGFRWDLYLTPLWTIFAQAKVGPHFGRVEEDCHNFNEANDTGSGIATDVGLGAFLNVSRVVSVRFDLTLRGVSAGLSLSF